MAQRNARWSSALAAAFALAFAAGAGCTPAPEGEQGGWAAVTPMLEARAQHSLTTLPDGRVLAAGGFWAPCGPHGGCGVGGAIGFGYHGCARPLYTAELFDPRTGTWSRTGRMAAPRHGHAAVLLPQGKVLVCCGWDDDDTPTPAELYDPATGTWTATGTPRWTHRGSPAVLLPTGQVLVAGGASSGGGTEAGGLVIAEAELYDPATGAWSPTGSLRIPRALHSATLLQSGQVLVAGGMRRWLGTESGIEEAERYDPATGAWVPAGLLGRRVSLHAATLLPSGNVLVAGGLRIQTSTPEWTYGLESVLASTYDPADDTWRATSSLTVPRFFLGLVTLPSGQALAYSGLGEGYAPGGLLVYTEGTRAERYDEALASWSLAAAMTRYVQFGTGATRLDDGSLLVSGGWFTSRSPDGDPCVVGRAERYRE